MIVAQRKKIPDLLEIVKNHKKLLLLGCGTCVTVCLAGGQREVSIIASALRMSAKLKALPLEIEELTIERQCDNVFIEQAADAIKRNDAVLSLGCGAGVQAIAECFGDKPVYAGLDTAFIGILEERGIWTEKCAACGVCFTNYDNRPTKCTLERRSFPSWKMKTWRSCIGGQSTSFERIVQSLPIRRDQL